VSDFRHWFAKRGDFVFSRSVKWAPAGGCVSLKARKLCINTSVARDQLEISTHGAGGLYEKSHLSSSLMNQIGSVPERFQDYWR